MAMPIAVRRFTVDEYHRMAEAGILHEDDRVELLDGQIVEMSPINAPHAGCVKRLNRLLSRALGDQAILGVQDPVGLAPHSEPQPDISVLKPRGDGYSSRNPEPVDILLLIEVADASVATDRLRKVPLYARARISETWLVNLPAGGVEIYRAPRDGRYRDLRTARRGETVSPRAFPGLLLQVDDILGPANP